MTCQYCQRQMTRRDAVGSYADEDRTYSCRWCYETILRERIERIHSLPYYLQPETVEERARLSVIENRLWWVVNKKKCLR